jgi:2'-5' RNA ligase
VTEICEPTYNGLIVIRSFVAIEIPKTMRIDLSEHIAHLKQDIPTRMIRWVRPEGIHLTLKFLGDVSIDSIDQISATLIGICSEQLPFNIKVSEFGCFPNFRRPRILWIGVQDLSTRLADLHGEIESGLSKLGFEREARRFHPHLTIGRVKRFRDRVEFQDLATALEDVKIGDIGQLHVNEVSLMKSDLKPTGAVYSRLLAARLGGGG